MAALPPAGGGGGAAAASPMVLMEQGRVGVGRRPVGVSWIGQEHLLVTSPSQVVLYSIHDGGARLREWSFRPSKATAFTSPALAASQQGLLLGLQGQRKLVAWPDKASLTAAGAAGPEGMQTVDVGFAASKLVAAQGPVGVAWCLGEEAGRVACFGTRAGALLAPLVASEEEKQASARILASLPSRWRPLLLVACADGSVRALVAAAVGDKEAAATATAAGISALRQSTTKASEPPTAGAELVSSGLMWAGPREEGAYHWTVWTTGTSSTYVRVSRVAVEAAGVGDAAVPALAASVLYGKDVGGSGEATAGRKRRRASVASAGEAVAVGVEVVGLEGEGALVVVDGARGILQAWDAQHGVALGEVSGSVLGGAWAVGEGGVLAHVAAEEGGEVAVWRVEAREGDYAGEGGLRRVLGKGLVSAPGAAAAALGAVLVFSGGEWVEEEAGAAAGGAKNKKGKGQSSQQPQEDEVEALLKLVVDAGGEQQPAAGEGKWGKAHGPLARTPVSSRTALAVARRCLDEEAPASKRRKGGKQEEASSPLWRLLGALLDAGRLPLRERPYLMEELLERCRLDLVKRVLAGPADVPERAVVRALQRALQQQQEGGGEQGDRVAGSLELVALAVRRPCCPAFLRTALAAELDGPAAALLLVLLKVLLEGAVRGTTKGGGKGKRPGEEQCLTWLEALLDANFVNLVLEGASAAIAGTTGRGGAVKQALEGVRDLAGEAAAACQALETVGGYVAQFRRAGHTMGVIPDYSLDTLVI